MLDFQKLQTNYLDFCHYQKQLNEKTRKAYRIDLNQFITFLKQTESTECNRLTISNYISYLHKEYKPKSAKRKIASLKAFFAYLEYEEIISENPFDKLKVKFQEPFLLPRTIPVPMLKEFFHTIYKINTSASLSAYQKKCSIRDKAVIELLFGTGLRVSELCSIKQNDIDLLEGHLRIYGKGSKERIIHIANASVLSALYEYQRYFKEELLDTSFFFVNRLGNRLSEQSVRFMINYYVKKMGISEHITPHMFRHTFATMLLEEDVDIRYIQQILGHSSIMTTQIYTHVSSNKQREILRERHPRDRIVGLRY